MGGGASARAEAAAVAVAVAIGVGAGAAAAGGIPAALAPGALAVGAAVVLPLEHATSVRAAAGIRRRMVHALFDRRRRRHLEGERPSQDPETQDRAVPSAGAEIEAEHKRAD